MTTELLDKYNVQGPRYTSYPTAPEWTDVLSRRLRGRLRAREREGVAGLPLRPSPVLRRAVLVLRLLHEGRPEARAEGRVRDEIEPYLADVHREIDILASHVDRAREIEQVHWGGGTPTYLTPRQADRLAQHLLETFRPAADAEVSVEVDPRVTTPEHLAVLRNRGFNRVSMGVQDFDPEVQELVNRVQPFEMTKALVEAARALGYASVNLDMIYGLPGQKRAGFEKSVEQIISLRPDRVAMYSYAHVPVAQAAAARPRGPSARGHREVRDLRLRHRALHRGGLHVHRHGPLRAAARRDRQGAEGPHAHPQLPGLHDARRLRPLRDGRLGDRHRSTTRTSRTRRTTPRTTPRRRQAASRPSRATGSRRTTSSAATSSRASSATASSTSATIERRSASALVRRDVRLGGRRGFPSSWRTAWSSSTPDEIRVTSMGRIFIRNVAMLFDAYLEKKAPDAPKIFSRTLCGGEDAIQNCERPRFSSSSEGPEAREELKPFLYELFVDPEILNIRFAPLRKLVAWTIATLRAPKSAETYERIGWSPIRRWSETQARLLEEALALRTEAGASAPAVRVGHDVLGARSWRPLSRSCAPRGAARLLVLPLYPQYSVTTTRGSFARVTRALATMGWAPESRRRARRVVRRAGLRRRARRPDPRRGRASCRTPIPRRRWCSTRRTRCPSRP